MAVTAVRARQVIPGLEGGTHPDGDGLLAEVGMEIAADKALAIEVDATGYEHADGVKLPIQLAQK